MSNLTSSVMFLQALRLHIGKCYFVFVYLTGVRREEALKVSENDVDTQNKVLAIHGDKTELSERSIPLVKRFSRHCLLCRLKMAHTSTYPTIISVENSVKYTKSIRYTTCAIRSARFKYAWRKSTSKLYPYGSDTRRLIRHCKHIPTPSNWTRERFCVAIYPKKRKFPYIGRNIKKFCS